MSETENFRLPEEFVKRMKNFLGAEYADFAAALSLPRTQGFRVNTLKVKIDDFMDHAPVSWDLSPIPWASGGFYYAEHSRPGRHPYHWAGLYYIQEPSAMAAAAVLAPQAGEKVLDLCAAPGGKATHLAALMGDQGLLVANEHHAVRAKVLASNLERWGAKNTVVANENPARLAAVLPEYFDRVLVDAPCSGEGMFRKDPEARLEWTAEIVRACARRQIDILGQAALLLKPGGFLVYSTCTFAPEENEGVLEPFLEQHPGFSVVELPEGEAGNWGWDSGRPEWAAAGAELDRCIRLWPHKVKGEGHFIALLQKNASDLSHSGDRKQKSLSGNRKQKSAAAAATRFEPGKEQLAGYYRFAAENLETVPEGNFLLFGDRLYLAPGEAPNPAGLKIVRPGWHLGTLKKGRFEPAHGLALGLAPNRVKRTAAFSGGDPDIDRYLHGEALKLPGSRGWTLVTVDGFSLGWGKHDGQLLKNHYPKGLRL